MRRLRERLDAHYDACTPPPPLRIVLPPRSYVPRFVPHEAEPRTRVARDR
jgi:hypothetical protein